MQFANTITVQCPVEDVWSALVDVGRVTPCVPGAEVLEHRGDDTYEVALKVKVGPVGMRYRGEVQLLDHDDVARNATLRGRAREVRGQGAVLATITMAAEPDSEAAQERTTVALQSDVTLSGKVASLGQGMLADVASAVLDAFADNLQAMLAVSDATDDAAPGSGTPGKAASSAASAPPGGKPAGVAAPGSLTGIVALSLARRSVVYAAAALACVTAVLLLVRGGRRIRA